MKQRLMDLYFAEGADLSNTDGLVHAAAETGLDPALSMRRSRQRQGYRRGRARSAVAKEAGIQGVPMFIFGGKFAISGAQAPEYLAQAIGKAAQMEAAE